MSPGLLEGKRLLVTGVATRDSIAWAAARHAQDQGRRWCSRASAACAGSPSAPPSACPSRLTLELDVNRPEDFEALVEELRGRWAARRRPARDRLRARGRPRRQLPQYPAGQRRPGLPHERLLRQGARRVAARSSRARGGASSRSTRRLGGVARL